MPVRFVLWKVGRRPVPLAETTLAREQPLDDMIVADPRLVSDERMSIGRQEADRSEPPASGGRSEFPVTRPSGGTPAVPRVGLPDSIRISATGRDSEARILMGGWFGRLALVYNPSQPRLSFHHRSEP
jgi:hypothetical protein